MLRELIRMGWRPITEWLLVGGGIKLASLKWKENAGWLYAFVVGDEAKYVGLTRGVLRSRMDAYSDHNQDQGQRIRECIVRELEGGAVVKIYRLPMGDPENLVREEERLRAELSPEWNLV